MHKKSKMVDDRHFEKTHYYLYNCLSDHHKI